jgi:hypothetical protein
MCSHYHLTNCRSFCFFIGVGPAHMHLPWCDNLRIDLYIGCDIVIMKPKERVNSRGGVLGWVFSGGVLSKAPIHFGIHGVLVAVELSTCQG